MVKAIIIYEPRYGNTKLVAEKIAEGINEVGGTEVSIKELREADLSEVSECDVILIGSPNHFGGRREALGASSTSSASYNCRIKCSSRLTLASKRQ